jgi:hypothetical protein
MAIKIKPISHWVGKETTDPRRSQFRQTYANTKKLLFAELEKLYAVGDVHLSMFIHPNQLRADGELRADAKPYKQGVVLTLTRVKARRYNEAAEKWEDELETLSYPCDKFDDWQDNLRAIALSLEALRRVERYGVFRYADMVSRLALPEVDIVDAEDLDDAAGFISNYSEFTKTEVLLKSNLTRAYRQAAAKLHPDKGGNHDKFVCLERCKQIIERWLEQR